MYYDARLIPRDIAGYCLPRVMRYRRTAYRGGGRGARSSSLAAGWLAALARGRAAGDLAATGPDTVVPRPHPRIGRPTRENRFLRRSDGKSAPGQAAGQDGDRISLRRR